MYMDKDLIKDKLYQLINQFNQRQINYRAFYFPLLDNRDPFYDGSQRASKILFYL